MRTGGKVAKRTLINCSKCGGAVVLDFSGSLKLVAPSFAITVDGIKNPVVDLQREQNPTAKFVCVGCHTEFDKDTINECRATCAMCQKEKPIAELCVTSYITPICSDCVKDAKSGGDSEISKVFNAPSNFRTFPLGVVLFKKIPTV
jgi:hypothetical protein